MSAADHIIKGLEEAVAVASGDQPAARIHIKGHAYVPEARIAALEAENARLREAQPGHERVLNFFQLAWAKWLSGCTSIDGGDVQDWLQESGVVFAKPYDPDTDGYVEDSEPGDPILMLAPEVSALTPPASAQDAE